MKFKFIFYLFGFLLILFANNVNATSSIADIPDICLQYNIGGFDTYKIWLWDYYSIDLDEVTNISFIDPQSLHHTRLTLKPGYSSFDISQFNISYNYEWRSGEVPYGTPQEEVISIQTSNSPYVLEVTVNMENPALRQVFNITISDNCYSPYQPDPVQYNNTGVFAYIKNYFPFENNLNDYVTNNQGVTTINPTYSTGKFGSSLNGSSAFINLSSFVSDLNMNNFSVSFWSKVNNGLSNANTEFLTSLGISAGFGTSWYIGTNDQRWEYGFILPGWQFSTIVKNSSGVSFYRNGTLVSTKNGNYNLSGLLLYYMRNAQDTALIDDFVIWNKSLSQSEITNYYNSGSGINLSVIQNLPINITTLPDIYMNGSSVYYYNISSYFSNYNSIYLSVVDPYEQFSNILYPGYITTNGDYFELGNMPLDELDGLITIDSYNRTYDFSFNMYLCLTSVFTNCITRTVTVHIASNLSDVISVNPFEYSYYIGETPESFSGNYYFQYYEDIIFSFPESNLSGNLDSFFNYTDILNNSDYPFMVFLSCDISQSSYTYNYTGDINITVNCGNEQSYFLITSNSDYNQQVYFTALNSESSLSDFTNLITTLPEEFFVPTGYEPDSGFIEENFYSFKGLLSNDVGSPQKTKMVFLILIIINLVIISLFYQHISFALHVCLWASIFVMFFFASARYMAYFFPVLILFLAITYYVIQVVRRVI